MKSEKSKSDSVDQISARLNHEVCSMINYICKNVLNVSENEKKGQGH